MTIAAIPWILLPFLAIPAGAPALAAEDGGGHPWFERLLLGMEVGPTGAQSGSDDLDERTVSLIRDWFGLSGIRERILS